VAGLSLPGRGVIEPYIQSLHAVQFGVVKCLSCVLIFFCSLFARFWGNGIFTILTGELLFNSGQEARGTDEIVRVTFNG
jgi:hypothetical protein